MVFPQIDYTNAANAKVLQVGQSTNILRQLNMTADQYNWVQSIYFVSQYSPSEFYVASPHHVEYHVKINQTGIITIDYIDIRLKRFP